MTADQLSEVTKRLKVAIANGEHAAIAAEIAQLEEIAAKLRAAETAKATSKEAPNRAYEKPKVTEQPKPAKRTTVPKAKPKAKHK